LLVLPNLVSKKSYVLLLLLLLVQHLLDLVLEVLHFGRLQSDHLVGLTPLTLKLVYCLRELLQSFVLFADCLLLCYQIKSQLFDKRSSIRERLQLDLQGLYLLVLIFDLPFQFDQFVQPATRGFDLGF
jgi:hypothetical protein